MSNEQPEQLVSKQFLHPNVSPQGSDLGPSPPDQRRLCQEAKGDANTWRVDMGTLVLWRNGRTLGGTSWEGWQGWKEQLGFVWAPVWKRGPGHGFG